MSRSPATACQLISAPSESLADHAKKSTKSLVNDRFSRKSEDDCGEHHMS
ncbi:hypothetical protein BN12_250012 [Nostocoides japonicum T1-X7]|uniref:Uncharacterized protein n=1 Tax=Nostocoides japonicum T1-X7 TaxID=1194083 RepID=A0A077LWI3_9MICO|nr:hypothetical protein BN12_250012 [Tetrasphaera japonica T1-X7]